MFPRSSFCSFVPAFTGVLWLAFTHAAFAAEIAAPDPAKPGLKGPERLPEPQLAAASDEPQKAMRKFQLPPGFDVKLWAAEPMLGNPVAFSIDERGAIYVAETHRYRTSTLDIRHYMFMLENDLANRTTDDRIAQLKRHFPNDWQKLQIQTEVVRRLEDTDGDGKADLTSPYAAEMNSLLDGINSGVLAHDGKVWCTNMPNLWLFSGLKDGRAENRESLSFGYGVRFSFTGHDMHGLALGPDGRLYFSFGDRGAFVKTKEGKTLAFSDEGAVFRCERDGSHLEPFYRGLRNPQELAFDNHGNLFTADNDCDQGDRERWVYLVEGGDAGWRVGWQHPPLGKERNMWLVEHMWEPRRAETPCHILSPILNIPDGPSGVAHNPGTGLPAEYDDAFLVCGFKGSSARSAISWWAVKESGAGFETAKSPATFLGEVQATDVDFGPDSRIYFAEWGEGWEGTGRGRVFRLAHEETLKAQTSQVEEVRKLLGDGFKQRASEELAKLLAHKDQRIRLNAQWALAEKNDAAAQFLALAKSGAGVRAESALSRLHGIWGLSHVARLAGYKNAGAEAAMVTPLTPLLADGDAEVRAQAAKALGAGKAAGAYEALVRALKDDSGRVRFFAAQALGQLAKPEAAGPLLELLRANGDKDEFIRHAAVVALIGSGNAEAIAAAAKDPAKSARLAALLVMRREQKPEIAQFLSDPEPLLVKEAARAINDEGIAGAFGELARLISTPSQDEPLMLRVLNANFRSGTPAAAQALADFATREESPEPLRVEALRLLATWPKPFDRDRIAGVFRPLGVRDAAPAVAAMQSALPKLLGAQPVAVALAAIDAVAALRVKEAAPALFALMPKRELSPKLRGRALEALARFEDRRLSAAIKLAVADQDAALRVAASAMLGRLNPDESAQQLGAAFGEAALPEKKAIINALAGLKGSGADKALGTLLDALVAGRVAPEVQLELIEAAKARDAPAVQTKLKSYEVNLPKGGPLAVFAPTLAGGSREEGERIFKEHAVAACLRCHKVAGSGGEAGPDLSGIAARRDRRYLLESIINPNAQIADGFQNIMVTLKNGDVQAGVVKAESETELTLQMPVPDAPAVKIAKAQIESRDNAPSGMPPNMGELLSRREIRDLVEYLASLR